MDRLDYLREALTGTCSALGAVLVLQKHAKDEQLARRLTIKGLEIGIEHDQGQQREWYDKENDKTRKTLMKHPYGYVFGTRGMDGEHIDCFIGPNKDAKEVYVIGTNKPPEFVQEDEQKCMIGFSSAAEAKAAFLDYYKKAGFFRNMRTFSYETFKKKVLATATTGPNKLAAIIRTGRWI
jgi:hypothetical protein